MGGSKKFLHLLRGFKKFWWLAKRGQKSLTTKIFNCLAPHQSIYEHSLRVSKIVTFSKHGKFLIWSCIVQSYTVYAWIFKLLYSHPRFLHGGSLCRICYWGGLNQIRFWPNSRAYTVWGPGARSRVPGFPSGVQGQCPMQGSRGQSP